jgi:hypothetical protein
MSARCNGFAVLITPPGFPPGVKSKRIAGLARAAGLVMALAGCALPGPPQPDPSVQYPIAGLPPPPYSVRAERLERPDPESDPVAARGFSGSAPAQVETAQPGLSTFGDEAEENLPPPPTFSSLADCERAFGPGQCRTGDEIFGRHAPAGTPVPPPIAQSYMPYAYSGMTGALAYGYLAPPGAYVVGVPYQSYVAPVVVSRYQVITPLVIQRYHARPVYVRETLIQRGPVVYDRYRYAPPPPRPPAPARVAPPPIQPYSAPRPAASSVAPAPPPPPRPAAVTAPAPVRPAAGTLGSNPAPAPAPVPSPSPGSRPWAGPPPPPSNRPPAGTAPAPSSLQAPAPTQGISKPSGATPPARPAPARDPKRRDEQSSNR